MPYYGSINVIDRSGWAKSFPLEKALVMIGSAAFNDIVLQEDRGGGVVPAHLQLIRQQDDPNHIRIVNLSTSPVALLDPSGFERANLAANSFLDVGDGDVLKVGDFSLGFVMQATGGFSKLVRSEHLGLNLELPGLQLRPCKQLAGLLTVANRGNQNRCQFEIDLDGLPGDCYQIDPAPLLYPNGEEHLRIRFIHRGTRPAGGALPVSLHMTAPGAYPTEEVVLSLILEVTPLYQYQVCILDRKDQVTLPVAKMASGTTAPTPVPSTLTAAAGITPPETSESVPVAPPSVLPTPEPAEPAPKPTPIPAQARPARTPEAEWWPEKTNGQPGNPNAEAYVRPGQPRKPRLPLSRQNIQVIKQPQPTSEEPPAGIPASETEGEESQ